MCNSGRDTDVLYGYMDNLGVSSLDCWKLRDQSEAGTGDVSISLGGSMSYVVPDWKVKPKYAITVTNQI